MNDSRTSISQFDRLWCRIRRIAVAVLVVWTVPLQTTSVGLAQEAATVQPVGRFLTLQSPLNDSTLGLVRRTGLKLQSIAEQDDRPAYLFLELKPGNSEFHHAWALADFLSSGAIASVHTVAWVPESLTGFQVLPALACNDVVMKPAATIGDIGRGKPLPESQQTIVHSIVERRRNPRISQSVVDAMMDPGASLVQLTLQKANDETETRLVGAQAARKLIDDGAVITDQATLKEAGAPWTVSGKQAQQRQILVSRLADSRREIADVYRVPVDSLRELITPDDVANVALIALHGEIDPVFQTFALNQIEKAVSDGVKTIIFEIDSPGGMVEVCMELSSRIIRLNESGIQTIAYIPKQAVSGGAILAVACTDIYMHPDATIGDAIPINLTVGGGFVHADPKILSFLAEHMRMLAKKTNRPSAVLEAFCDPKLEVFEVTHKQTGRKWFMSENEIEQSADEWIVGPRVPESRPEVAIFVSGERAHELKVAAAPVQDLDALKERMGLPLDMEFQVAQRSWIDGLVFFLNDRWVTGMLFFLAIVCIYIEMATMTGFFGIISAAAFGVFFWSRMLGGTATSLELLFFVLGIGCLAMEIFVIPGFGVFGLSGILMIIGSLVMASVTFSGLGFQYDTGKFITALGPFAASMVGVVIFATVLSRYLPHVPLLRHMVLAPPTAIDESDGPRLQEEHARPHSALVGATGKAVTVLRPAGKAQVNGQLYDVVSDGPYIEDGRQIKVVQVSGNRIVVSRCADV